MASVIEHAIKQWRVRLKELEAKMAPLAKEAEELRKAISFHDGAKPARARRGRRAAAASRTRSARTATRSRARRASTTRTRRTATSRARKPRTGTRARTGNSRQAIVAALKAKPGMTSGEVAARTGLNRNTVATAMSKMAAKGELRKAKRGYRVP